MKIEIEIPTEILVWQSPDKMKAACPAMGGRMPVLVSIGMSVGVAVYVKSEDALYHGDDKKRPEDFDWWAKLPIPPGHTESDPMS